jgi:hypothetical protein
LGPLAPVAQLTEHVDLAFADLPRHVRFHIVPSTAHRCGIKQIAAGRAIRDMARPCQSGSVRDSKLEQEPKAG